MLDRQFGCASKAEWEVTAVSLRQWDEGERTKDSLTKAILSEVILYFVYKATTHVAVEHELVLVSLLNDLRSIAYTIGDPIFAPVR